MKEFLFPFQAHVIKRLFVPALKLIDMKMQCKKRDLGVVLKIMSHFVIFENKILL
jgi:hypothetical protein